MKKFFKKVEKAVKKIEKKIKNDKKIIKLKKQAKNLLPLLAPIVSPLPVVGPLSQLFLK
jgi:hypothetical protein